METQPINKYWQRRFCKHFDKYWSLCDFDCGGGCLKCGYKTDLKDGVSVGEINGKPCFVIESSYSKKYEIRRNKRNQPI